LFTGVLVHLGWALFEIRCPPAIPLNLGWSK